MVQQIQEGNLSEVRTEIQFALTNFHAHIKYTMTVMSMIVVIAIGLFTFGLEHNDPQHRQILPGINVFLYLSSASFFLLIPVAVVAEKICRRYYLIYASNYIYYARLHLKYGLVKHPWVQNLFTHQGLDEENLQTDRAVEDFLCGKRSTDKNSWVFYRIIIWSYLLVGAIGGIIFLALGVKASA